MHNLKLLSANVMKSSDVCHSLLNDENLRSFYLLLLTEPWANIRSSIPHSAPICHAHWQPFFPSILDIGSSQRAAPFRSMIWASRRHICRQIPILHSNITAISMETTGRSFLIVSMYIPCSTNQKKIDEERLITRLNLISKVFTEQKKCLKTQTLSLY